MSRAATFRSKVKDVLYILVVFILPPIPVGCRYGVRSSDFWINLLLFILFPIFSVVHGIYILMLHPRPVGTDGYIAIDEESQVGSCCNANSEQECDECSQCCATQDAPAKVMTERPLVSEQAGQGSSESPSYQPPAYTETNHSSTFDNKVQSNN